MAQVSQSFFRHKGVKWVAAGWAAFIAENLVLSHHREYLIHEYGDDTYHIVYNILSTAACSSIAYGFFRHGKIGGPSISPPGPLRSFAGFTSQLTGFVGLSQLAPPFQLPVGFGSIPTSNSMKNAEPAGKDAPSKMYVRCPVDFRSKRPDGQLVYGVERITRHPALWFLGIAGLGSAVTTVYAAHKVMFSFPLIFAAIGSQHQDYRYRRGNGGVLSPEMEAVTSNVPFVALAQGRQKVEDFLREMKWTNAGIAALGAAGLAIRRIR